MFVLRTQIVILLEACIGVEHSLNRRRTHFLRVLDATNTSVWQSDCDTKAVRQQIFAIEE
ncbi:hypothetical protein SAMN05443432_10411 [Roseovarius litoreus]|uniref:Uncharacterized protein n=1 Tax=Roseovarius litoreus TaxID=1155722 RepID=A0A1M7F1X7_9RHOB|nr:hypothetical protein SAMN05443432_10411 [Roseovarius litoreus]